jgi:hypothetical protein
MLQRPIRHERPLGAIFDDQRWPKVMDLTQWSWTIWFPFVAGDRGEASLWPHSPPLPEPTPTDGVCEVSRGENAQTTPNDCPVNCGDAICQSSEGENTMSCPGDCQDRS